MTDKTLLVANRGEIAIRVLRTAREMGFQTLAIFAEDDAASLHTQHADDALPLQGSGPAAYLDSAQIIALATAQDVDIVHPGYGFLSENADFAAGLEQAGIVFAGPTPDVLRQFGDKTLARELAERLNVPTIAGTGPGLTEAVARAFLEEHGAIVIKAIAGGGGRGMRIVREPAELAAALERCASEAAGAFGDATLYAERVIEEAKHIHKLVVSAQPRI